MTNRFLACCLALLALWPAGNLHAKDHRYKDLYDWAQGVQWFNSQPDRKYATAFIQVRSHEASVPVGDVRLIIHAKDKDIVVPLSPTGELDLPMDGALVLEDPPIEFSSRVGVSVSVRVSAPPQLTFDYRLLLEMAAEYHRLVSRQDFLPEQFKSMHVRGLALSGADDIEASSTCGLKSPRKHRMVVIPYDADVPADCTVTLSRLPSSMELAFKWF